jgi:acyl-coenzyme A thioesterase PaaI-like protein
MDNRRDFIKAGLAIGATAALSGVASASPNTPDLTPSGHNRLTSSEHALVTEAGYKLIPRVQGYGDLTSPDTANGLPMDVYRKDERIYSWVNIPEHFAGWKDATTSYAHDGAVATVLSTVSGFQAMIATKQPARSKSVSVSFIEPVAIGKRVRAEARVKEVLAGQQIIVEAAIYESDRLLASSTAVWELFSEKAAAQICQTADVTAFNRNMETHFANG